MSVILKFIRATLLGGIVFLLPVGVILVVLGHLLKISRGAAAAIHDALLPGMDSRIIPLLIAIGILLVMAFAAGLFARTAAGGGLFAWLEGLVLARLPVYTILRQTLMDMAGGADRLAHQQNVKVVLVRFDDITQIGFLIERRPDGTAMVFLPGAPSALSGAVVIVEADRVTETALAPETVMASMRRLGAGLFARMQA